VYYVLSSIVAYVKIIAGVYYVLSSIIAYMKIVKTAIKIKRTFFGSSNGALKAHVLSHFVTLCHTCAIF
jgi:hypothetical protein